MCQRLSVTQSNLSNNSSVVTSEDGADPTCRICLSSDLDARELLHDVCGCRGSQRFVHNRCLVRWRMSCLAEGRIAAWRQCTVCQEPFRLHQSWYDISLRHFNLVAGTVSIWKVAVFFLLASFVYRNMLMFVYLAQPTHDGKVWEAGLSYLETTLNCSIVDEVGNITTRLGNRLPQDIWYGLIETGSSSCEVVTGAQLVNWSRPDGGLDLLLHGGWDDCRGARDSLLVAARQDIVIHGNKAWVDVPVSRDSLRDCPGSVYGHTTTVVPQLSTETAIVLFVLGGQVAGGYRQYSDRWGLLEVSDFEGRKRSRWRRCGASFVAQRAWHTATLLPGSSRVFVCGGRDGLQNLAAGIFDIGELAFGGESFEVVEGGPCLRQGHSAVLHGKHIYIIGGTNHLGGGLPWAGDDLEDVSSFQILAKKWSPPHRLLFDGASPVRRQHTAIAVTNPSDLDSDAYILLYGGGLGGKADTTLLVIKANASGLQSAALHSLRDMFLAGCAAHLPLSVAPPRLRGHTAVWTGQELFIYGGAEHETQGYFGLLVARLNSFEQLGQYQ